VSKIKDFQTNLIGRQELEGYLLKKAEEVGQDDGEKERILRELSNYVDTLSFNKIRYNNNSLFIN